MWYWQSTSIYSRQAQYTSLLFIMKKNKNVAILRFFALDAIQGLLTMKYLTST